MNLKKKATYLEEYDIIDGGSKKSLLYNGDIYHYDGSKTAFFYFKRRMIILSILYIFLWLLVTTLNPVSLRGKGNPFVMIPYVLLLFLIAYIGYSSIRLSRLPIDLEHIMYDQYIVKPNICTIFIVIFSLISFSGQIYIMIDQKFIPLHEVLTALCFLLLAALGIFSYRLQSEQQFENIGKNNSNYTMASDMKPPH